MSLLNHPEAQALLADAVVTADAVAGQADRLTAFLQRYLPRFYRVEQRATAALVIRGRLGGLQRKTSEPIAIEAGLPRKPIQFFVGAGKWDDEAVMGELRQHVREELADPDGVVIVDPSGFPKKGAESCGVDRQWCGRLGKVDNCQVGVFLAYATEAGYAPLDRRLYLPRSGPTTRPDARSATSPRRSSSRKPGGSPWTCSTGACPACPTAGSSAMTSWVGPPSSAPRCVNAPSVMSWTCRATPRCATWSGVARPARRPGWAASARCPSCGPTPGPHDSRSRVGSGSRSATARRARWMVDAMSVRVRTKQDGRVGPEERLVVIRPVGESRIDYALSNAGPETPWPSGPSPTAPAPDRGGVRRWQGGGGAGSLRGEELGGLAPPHDAVAGGVVVLVPGTTASRGGKPRR